MLDAIQTGIQTVTKLGSFALVTPKFTGYQPQNTDPEGLGKSILFHIEKENTTTLTTDITDHVVEDNTVINDHAALKPEIVTVSGMIGEVNNVTPESLWYTKLVRDKLQLLSEFTPELALNATRVFNLAEQAYQVATATYNQVRQSFSDIDAQNEQQKFYQIFYNCWSTRTLFTILTPWGIFDDMIIQVLKSTQGESDRFSSDFEITFKKMRFAKTQTAYKDASGRVQMQKAESKIFGMQTGETSSKTVSGLL